MDAIYIAGPTASGKSAVALELAERLGGEIVSVDSMQIFRGMDIGTAKPSPEERRRVPHHLIDVAGPSESFDAARFVTLARAAEQEIRQRGRAPIFCGGTGLYFNALLGGLPENAPPNPELRSELEATPVSELLAELRERDPETFARVDLQNPRRVIRAVEILRTTGQPISATRPPWRAPAAAEHCEADTPNESNPKHFFCLDRERPDLHSRINQRVDAMFAAGIVAETAALLQAGLRENRVAMQAIGYRQVVEHLEGARELPETIELVKLKTRQYAKRQLTWFRRQLSPRWIPVSPGASVGAITQQILPCLA